MDLFGIAYILLMHQHPTSMLLGSSILIEHVLLYPEHKTYNTNMILYE